MKQTSHRASYYFWIFIILHTLLWTIGTALSRPTLPHDTLEGITWGLQWQLGYNKHPFLAAWLCASVTQWFHNVGWPVYFLAQCAVSLTFIAAWQLARHFVSATAAVIAALLLEGVLFYNINSFNFTPDTLQSPLWAWLSLFFYRALSTQKLRYWLLTALFASLCLLTKYQAVILLTPMLLFCLLQPAARQSFTKPGIYIALASCLLLLTPHIVWLVQHQFITLHYAQHVSSEYTKDTSPLRHLLYPLRFLMNNSLNIAGLFLLAWPFYRQEKIVLSLSSFQQQFLVCIGLAPLLLTLLLCFISGDYFPSRWATPYFFALGILTMVYLRPVLNSAIIYRFAVTLVLFSVLLFAARMSTFSLFPRATSDAFLPNQQIAATLDSLWQEKTRSKLHYIAGSHYLVALITPYLPEKTQPYLGWNSEESPWINEQQLRQYGGLFVWDAGANYAWDENSKNQTQLPAAVKQRFPDLQVLPNQIFYRGSDKSPVVIGVALLMPRSQRQTW